MQDYIRERCLERHADVINAKYEKDLPVYTADPVRYLVDYQKSQMFDWTGLMQSDYCIPDDVVFGFFMGRHCESRINAQAMKELRAERALPECKVWVGNLTEIPENLRQPFHELKALAVQPNEYHKIFLVHSVEEPIRLFGHAILMNPIFTNLRLPANLEDFGVFPEFRKKGYGQAMLKEIKKFGPISIRCESDESAKYFEQHATREAILFKIA